MSTLQLRLRRPSGSWLSSSEYWQNYYGERTIISGVSTDTPFRISACCEGQDNTWSGDLTY